MEKVELIELRASREGGWRAPSRRRVRRLPGDEYQAKDWDRFGEDKENEFERAEV